MQRTRWWNSRALVPRFVGTILDLLQEVRWDMLVAVVVRKGGGRGGSGGGGGGGGDSVAGFGGFGGGRNSGCR